MPSVRPAKDRAMIVDVDLEAMVALIKDAGTSRFIEAMLEFCWKSIRADFVSIFDYSGTAEPTLVGTATTTEAENARKAAIGYMKYFGSDVNFHLASRRRAGTYNTYQTAREIASCHYRRACYDRTGIADRLSLVCVEPVRSTSVSAYRSHGNGCFSDRELDRARGLLPILMASADKHNGVGEVVASGKNAAIKDIQASLKARYPRMSMRELEVAALAKAGMSARLIAAELGIAETTVITHRNSAYARVGVKNLRELLLA
jgi:DNA-binding CsgD family transcriptional regulator